ncbi:O-antigen ligase family protein [Glaciecola siphonariae]|uniref:O-antigen ligase family protein n=1 Tax=Glaciecola siphonariae TaxID=521012 RepID=A0ABV9LUE9_9ALTE
MVKILTILAILAAGFFAISAPYIAALLYTTVSILQPQYIWFWVFDDISIFRISAGIAIIAWLIHMLRGGINWQMYNNGIFFGLLGLLALYYLSNAFTPFPSYGSRIGSELVMGIFTTIVIMFFIVLGLINHEKALKLLVVCVVIVTLYYTYWANSAYLEGNWSQFTRGRLNGPRGSPYKDGNIFSVLFVVGLPFVLFAVGQVEKTWQKALLILAIPLIWHAMILCASRGALLSAAVSTLLAARMIKSKSFNMVLLAGALVFLIDQGGEMLSRTVSTVKKAETEANEPINPRVISWQIAFDLAKKHPVLGVGPQRFLEASRFYFPGKSPHVAHNTFLNYAANLGFIAAFIYLMFFWVSWKMYKWNRDALEAHPDKLHTYINKASFCSLVGFFVGATFLDLIIFEPFYFLLIIIIANNFILKQKVSANEALAADGKKQEEAGHEPLANAGSTGV